jgi:SAM-dependent methyltransferase
LFSASLEIGTGVGTDARQMIMRGANYHGINIDQGSCVMTRKALDVFGLVGQVQQMSATDMRFQSNLFDIVYSFGVLHHIPNVEKAISEIRRVLKPGGYLLFMVYNRSSINYQVEIRYLRKWILRVLAASPWLVTFMGRLGFPKDKLSRHVDLFKKYGKMSDDQWLSRNTDGPDNPYSRVYDKDEIPWLLCEGFKILKNEVYYFDWRHWGVIGRLMPKTLVSWLGKHWGWHRVVLAQKC